MKEATRENLKILIKYTILFGIMVIGVYFFFLLDHKSFIQYGDGYRQGYFWIVELKHNLEALFAGDGFSFWSWYKGLGVEVTLPTDPFNIVAALFPVGYIELGYTFAIMLRMYCSGLAFILLARELNMSSYKCIIGSLCYTFSGWAVGVGLVQANFLINTVLFPLLILGVEKIYKKKSPVLFILVVAYYVIRNLVFAYMAAIMAILYILIRYFAHNEEFKIKEYVTKIGIFILYGIAGICISTVALLPSFTSLSGASTEAADTTSGIFYSINHYYDIIARMICFRFDGGGYSCLGISVFLVALLPIAFRKLSLKKTPEIFVLICFFMSLFPFFSSMFNGFSYSTGRWTFMFMFFIILSAIDVLDKEHLTDNKNRIIIAITWIVLVLSTCGFHYAGINTLTEGTLLFVTINLIGSLFALIIAVVAVNSAKKETVREVIVTVIILATLVIAYNSSFNGNLDPFLRNSKINNQLEESTQRVGNQIPDDGFYRIDQVDGICVNKELSKPANETLWWQTKSIYVYDSKIPANYLKFNKLVGNNSGYTERVAIFSNDNRMGLDFITGVKYFLGNDINEELPSSQYASYGFKPNGTIDGVEILENKYDVGLGFVYDSFISESEFMKLSRLEREQALMQAVVVSDEEKLNNVDETKKEQIKTHINDVKYSITETDGIKMEQGCIIAEKDFASFIVNIENIKNSQLVISFDNLIRQSSTRAEGGAFEIVCETDALTKKAYNKLGNQGMPDIFNYDINLGYYENYDGNIKITLSEAGTYTFDKLYISAMKADLYDEFATDLIERKYNIVEYGDHFVKGYVESNAPGVLYLSILNNGNWDVYIDGQKTEQLSATNIAFTGVAIDAGHHEVELRYNNMALKIGALISSIALLALIVICVYIWYIKRRNQKIK